MLQLAPSLFWQQDARRGDEVVADENEQARKRTTAELTGGTHAWILVVALAILGGGGGGGGSCMFHVSKSIVLHAFL